MPYLRLLFGGGTAPIRDLSAMARHIYDFCSEEEPLQAPLLWVLPEILTLGRAKDCLTVCNTHYAYPYAYTFSILIQQSLSILTGVTMVRLLYIPVH